MPESNDSQSGSFSQSSEEFGKVPQPSESFGSVPKDSETFRNLPHDSETFRSSQRKENHTLTVRETARLFEAAGVARTERSIVNWCQANAQGIARLDAYFDPNERKYYITPQSVELAIAEEKAKAQKNNSSSEPVASVPNPSETSAQHSDIGQVRELEREIIDLKIANRSKDLYIERMHQERDELLDQLLTTSRKVGELETRLLQIESPTQHDEKTKEEI